MEKIYACLTGKWVCLNDDPESTIFEKSPSVWWEENAPIFAPVSESDKDAQTMYTQKYVNIIYKGKNYRIHPIHIQIVTE